MHVLELGTIIAIIYVIRVSKTIFQLIKCHFLRMQSEIMKKYISMLFLSLYLFFMGAGVLHSHDGHHHFPGYGITYTDPEGHNDIFADKNSNCSIYQLISSLDFNCFDCRDMLAELYVEETVPSLSDPFDYSINFLNNHSLRAPPFNS